MEANDDRVCYTPINKLGENQARSGNLTTECSRLQAAVACVKHSTSDPKTIHLPLERREGIRLWRVCQSVVTFVPPAALAETGSPKRLRLGSSLTAPFSDVIRASYSAPPRIISPAFSAIIITAALVLPPITSGMIEASTTRRFSTP